MGFPCGSDGKESVCNAGDLGSIPGEGNGNPLQYPCLKNSMDRGTWQATFHGVAKSQIQLSDCHSLSDTATVYALHTTLKPQFVEHFQCNNQDCLHYQQLDDLDIPFLEIIHVCQTQNKITCICLFPLPDDY